MSTLKCPDEVLHFPNHMHIEISYTNTVSYIKCRTYDAKLMSQGFVWHQIVVQHMGKCSGIEGKKNILEAIYMAIEGEEFYPVTYRRGNKEDRFLVRQCQPALDKLFAQNLRVQLSNGLSVNLQVQLNVGEFKYGQISPISQITKALNTLYERMDELNGEEGILNLTRFCQNREFFDFEVNMGNRGVLERICDLIYRNDEKFRKVNGIIFSENGITTLAPLQLFAGVEFAVLDFRDNNLRSPSRVCRDLEHIKADDILLAGNPLTKGVTYPECLRPVLKNFKKIDGIPSENLSKDYSPLDNRMETESEGYRIDWSNKADIIQFESSTDWHAFMIPDASHEFSKEEIFDYFFLTISNTLSDIYPCYTFTSGEHQFLVRQCFPQIKHLVEICNLEIKIPRIAAPPPPNEFTTDYSPQVLMDKTLVYYIHMNISPFKKGQIEPMECIEKALNRRFSAMDRMLNLNNFQNIEGLENIVVNLSSPKILTRVLMQAARKFLSTCIELRLAQNKILSANFSKVLAMMSNLKAIDLGNNWIHDLHDIKDLGILGIKSLRLDGNPLCSKFSFAGEYIKTVKKYFPELKTLDSIEITKKGNLSSQKNFLCDVAGYNLVDEFITRYFKAFEHDRIELKDLYHRKSILTITCNYNVAKLTPQNIKRISKYTDYARNIDKLPDFARAYTTMHYGPNEIMRVLMDLPGVTHDMLTFSTDCTVYKENMIAITVNGVYLDQAPSIVETDILMGFSRTFILTPVQRKAGTLKHATIYQIINDQFNVYNPTATQTKIAFKYFKSEDKSKNDELTIADKEAFLVMFQETTNLKSIWCTRCLEEAEWNFQKALEIFLQLHEKKEIPIAAFN